ncbi:MAG TPA: response regulator [Verrucomicrobiae bacterium]|nr:response regulator [Verrucomicrobiae bacterium]
MNIPREKSGDGTFPPNNSVMPINLCCFAPAAKVVQLAGDFNQWHPILMKRQEDGWWFIQLWLPYGRHRYRFLLDGEPMLDWHASGTARDDHNEPVSFIVVEPPLDVPTEKDKLAPGKSLTRLPQRILMVEDDLDILRLCSELLIDSGYQVDTAEDGEAGWRMLHGLKHGTGSYDLLITDNIMPKLSGVELIKKLRSARMTLPVILVSGSNSINTDCLHLAESLQLGSILPKPFFPARLAQLVKEVLRRSTVIANGNSSSPKARNAFGDGQGESIRIHFFKKNGALRQKGQTKERI